MSAPDDALSRLLRRAQGEQRLPSVVACVFRDGEPAWTEAVGLADVEHGREATADTQYRVGSITKTFSAAAVVQLRDAGALDLDAPVGAFVRELSDGRASLRRLLSHLSGLQREQPGGMWETLEMPSRDELLKGLAGVEQLLPPGLHWHYSNLAYVLLGEVVERVSGRPYRTYVDDELLAPLGLERTTWSPVEPAARGYLVEPWSDRVREEPPVETESFAAAGQLWSTAGDLARWGAFLADPDPAVLAPASVEEMRTVQAMADGERWLRGWGLGLALDRRGDRIWSGHGGAMPGFLAYLVVRHQERVGAVVLTNSGAGAAVDELALALGGEALDAVEPRVWRPLDEDVPEDVRPLLGAWWSEGEEFLFAWRGGRLEARVRRAPEWVPPAVLEPVGGDRYRTASGRERGEWLRVVRDEDGGVVRLSWAGYAFTRSPATFG